MNKLNLYLWGFYIKMNNDFGLSEITKQPGYSSYEGNYVKVYSNGCTFYGKLLESEQPGMISLQPSLVDYSTPKDIRMKLETKCATKININSISAIQPINKTLLEDICTDTEVTNESEK